LLHQLVNRGLVAIQGVHVIKGRAIFLAFTAFFYCDWHRFAATSAAVVVPRQFFSAMHAEQLVVRGCIQAKQALPREQVMLYIF